MIDVNVEYARQFIQQEVATALQEFIGMPVSRTSIAQVNSACARVIESLVQRGILVITKKVPLVDVNHAREISYLTGKVRELNSCLCEIDDSNRSAWSEVNNEIWRTVQKRNALEGQLDGPNSIKVFFKNDDFTPFDWEGIL